jgi:hypothetical protein
MIIWNRLADCHLNPIVNIQPLDFKMKNIKRVKFLAQIIVVMTAVSCSPYESNDPQKIVIEGIPFKIWKLSNSNSYQLQLDDFWCQRTDCVYKAEYTPLAVKAIEYVSKCDVDTETVSVLRQGNVMVAVRC